MKIPLRVMIATLTSVLACAAHGAELLQRGVLVARETAAVVFMSPDSTIEKVSISSGKTEWISHDGAMPIALNDGSLLVLRDAAERGKLPYAVLADADGTLVARAAVDLPATAAGLVDDRLGERFELLAAADGLRWSYQREQVQGARMTEDQGYQESKQAATSALSGALAIDWAAGTLAPVPEASLKSLATQAAEIGSPSATGPRTFRSVGDDYRLRSERQEDGRYRWLITDASGARVGEMVSDYSYRPFDVVAGKLLYVTTPQVSMIGGRAQIEMPTLMAFDLASGALVWQREIRDTRYRGPLPS